MGRVFCIFTYHTITGWGFYPQPVCVFGAWLARRTRRSYCFPSDSTYKRGRRVRSAKIIALCDVLRRTPWISAPKTVASSTRQENLHLNRAICLPRIFLLGSRASTRWRIPPRGGPPHQLRSRARKAYRARQPIDRGKADEQPRRRGRIPLQPQEIPQECCGRQLTSRTPVSVGQKWPSRAELKQPVSVE